MILLRDDNYERLTDINKCWYKGVCDKFQTEKCSFNCKKFTQTDYLFQLSNLPKSMWKPIKLSTEYLEPDVSEILNTVITDCEFFVKKGFNLYLYGEPGCGKTSWAVKIMNGYFSYVAEQNDFRTRGLYVSVPSFLRDAKMFLVTKSENFKEFLETIKVCDIVIWDDVGQTDTTNFESQWLYSYINERIFAKKCNIFTSNLSPDELRKHDERLESRICTGSDCLHIEGLDMRFTNTYTYFMNSEEVVEFGSDSNAE